MSAEILIPVPGLEGAVDRGTRDLEHRLNIHTALLDACREKHSGVLVDLYLREELPPQAKRQKLRRIEKRRLYGEEVWFFTAYVTREAAVRTAKVLNRTVRCVPARLYPLLDEAAYFDLGVRFMTERGGVLFPPDELTQIVNEVDPGRASGRWEEFDDLFDVRLARTI